MYLCALYVSHSKEMSLNRVLWNTFINFIKILAGICYTMLPFTENKIIKNVDLGESGNFPDQ